MKDIVDKVKQLANENEQAVLATIVGVDGSTYRKEGAKMIFARSGKQFGTISAGCLEADIALKIEGILDSGQPEILTYDMRSEEDLLWGLGSGCNGKIDVFVEPIFWEWIPPFQRLPIWPQIDDLLKQGHHVAAAKSIDGQIQASATCMLTDKGQVIGTLGSPEADRLVKERLEQFLAQNEKKQTVVIEGLGTTFFLDRYEPKNKLFLFGAGPDAEPVARSASKINFEVIVIDHRESRNTEEFFPDASQRIIAHPERALEEVPIHPEDYALIMTHSFEKDRILLSKLVQQPIKYLGVLGPILRTQKLLDAEQLPEWIHSPVGLDIGADGPEEIAVSIMAELLAVRNEKDSKTVKPRQAPTVLEL
ncbi:XdhC family protein [Ferviditalea candida]|uniref:XdhC family protein n=1 Tax=Ferviditalea candida TaxID=3108399 RepID=A0ABU5ZNY1_9BACL|nr:XdhC family protein [Paenibacillaceae bacterium T2]